MPGDQAEYDGLSAEAQDAVTRAVVNMGKAIGAYERKLACGPGRFDAWMHGGQALDASEQRGAELFVGKAQCVKCHSGPHLSDRAFHNVGIMPAKVNFSPADVGDHGAAAGLAAALADPLDTRGLYSDGDDGRLEAPVPAGLEGAFKTPMLRCATLRPRFMHTGQLRTLAEVVSFFDRGGDHPEIGTSEVQPLGLTASERDDLVSFMRTLTGPGADAALSKRP
jgi:cytochrome c peroxidase